MSFRLRWLMVLLFLVVPIALVPSVAMAQQSAPSSGAEVHGLVLDPDNALIPGATVTLTSSAGKTQTTASKSDGTYSFRGVAAGTYTLNVTAPGFADYSKPTIQVSAGANLNLDAVMTLAEQTQQVNVTTDTVALSVDPENNASSSVITGASLDALSDDPDDLQSELTALAGPSAGPSGGQIYIDGFTGGQLPPKSSILAIRINQNPFSAQYPELGYGRIEVITKPGTDTFHGYFTSQFQDKDLNTSTPFLGAQNVQPPYHTLFFMGNLTGPVRNGMSFTLSGSRRTIQNNAIIYPQGGFYASSPTSTTLCAPGDSTCTSYPFPTTARALFEPQTRWDISPRLDMMLGQKNTMTVRYQYESNASSVDPAIASALLTPSSSSSSNQELQISETQLWSSKVINETRFEYVRGTSNSLTGNPGYTSPEVKVSGGFDISPGSQTNSTNDHEEFQNYTSIQLVKNFIRFGGMFRSSGESNYSNSGLYGTLTYNYLLDPCTDPNQSNRPAVCTAAGVSDPTPCAYLTAGNNTNNVQLPSSYQCNVVNQFSYRDFTNSTIGARETDVGLYAEDDWKAKSNLTISYGFRLEAQNVINSSHDFAPRVSIAYGIPRKNGATPLTVIRGGFGVFFQRFSLNQIQSQIAKNGVNSVRYTYANTTASTSCTPTYSGGEFTGYSSDCTSGSGTATYTTATLNDPSLRTPYTAETAATLEQQVGKYATLSVTYLNARGFHQFVSRGIPGFAGTDVSQIPNVNQSEGVYRQNQINTNIHIQTPKGLSVGGYYSANWVDSNDGSLSDPFSSTVDYGRANYDVRSRLALFGSIPLPFNITASPFIFVQSGSPYNITTGLVDSVTQGYNDRPTWVGTGPMPSRGSFAQCVNRANFSTSNGLDLTPGSFADTEIPVNFCTGPANASFNIRLAKTIGFGPKTAAALAAQRGGGPGGPGGPRGPGGPGGGGGYHGGGGGRGGFGGGSNTGRKYNLSLGAQAFNLFNEVNYGSPSGTISNPQFGQTTTLAGAQNLVRRITLQATFNF